MKRIVAIFTATFAAIMLYGYIDQGTLWLPFMVLLGATVGILMGLVFPFAVTTKITMIVGLIASAWAIYFGFKNNRRVIGQAFAVGGIFLWSFIGLMGLGTGT